MFCIGNAFQDELVFSSFLLRLSWLVGLCCGSQYFLVIYRQMRALRKSLALEAAAFVQLLHNEHTTFVFPCIHFCRSEVETWWKQQKKRYVGLLKCRSQQSLCSRSANANMFYITKCLFAGCQHYTLLTQIQHLHQTMCCVKQPYASWLSACWKLNTAVTSNMPQIIKTSFIYINLLNV